MEGHISLASLSQYCPLWCYCLINLFTKDNKLMFQMGVSNGHRPFWTGKNNFCIWWRHSFCTIRFILTSHSPANIFGIDLLFSLHSIMGIISPNSVGQRTCSNLQCNKGMVPLDPQYDLGAARRSATLQTPQPTHKDVTDAITEQAPPNEVYRVISGRVTKPRALLTFPWK